MMKYRMLGNTGMNVSYVSLGASAIGGVYRDTDINESCEVVKKSLAAGINYIDCAPWYGNGKSEEVLGKALTDVPRDSYYLTTKVCRYEKQVDKMFDFSAERTLASVDESLRKLKLDYVDVIQVHDMEFAPNLDIIINETLPALQKVKDSGKARFIGITGYPIENFRKVIERSAVKIDTILTYCHLSMNDSSLLDHLDFFKERGIGVVNASPLSMGLLTHRQPPSWHPAQQNIKDACANAARYCEERGCDLSRLAMNYTYSFDEIPTTLVSTASTKNLDRNLSALTELSNSEKQTLDEVMEKFMKPLKNQTWECLEVEKYWKDIKVLQEKAA